MLKKIFGRPRFEPEAHDLYVALVRQARQPEFYRDLGVPDTADGRFEMILLHAFLVIHRLNAEIERTRELSQQVFDVMFGDMDSGLREMGVGDVGVGKRIKGMVASFYGRVTAYQSGLNSDDDELRDALDRNVFVGLDAGPGVLDTLARYVRQQHRHLSGQKIDQLIQGKIDFDQGALAKGII